MKTNKLIALIGTLGVLAASTALAQSDPAATDNSTPQRSPQGRPGWNRPDPEVRKQALLNKYDANKDGNLDQTELAAIGKDVVDGSFHPGPMGAGPGFGAGRRGFGPQGEPGFGPGRRGFGPQGQAGLGRGPRGDFAQAGPGFGPGPRGPRALNGPGLGPRHQEMLDKYDANKDGKIDDTEREAIRKDIESGKLVRPHWGPPGPRGPIPHPDAPASPEAPPAGDASLN